MKWIFETLTLAAFSAFVLAASFGVTYAVDAALIGPGAGLPPSGEPLIADHVSGCPICLSSGDVEALVNHGPYPCGWEEGSP